MPSEVSARHLPDAEAGRFGSASTRSYAAGFWLGLTGGAWWLLERDLSGGSSSMMMAFGTQSAGWTKVWSWVLYMILGTPVSGAAIAYHSMTGRRFVDDRVGFARAGGQDIGLLSGLLAVALCLPCFMLAPSWLPAWLRIPLLFLSTIVCGNAISTRLARRVFSVLFGLKGG